MAEDFLPADELARITAAIADRFRRLLEDRAASFARSRGHEAASVADVHDALEDLETCEIDVDDLIEVYIDDDDEEGPTDGR